MPSATTATPPIVCGRQLKVLSAGHYLNQLWFKVAFASETEAIPTARDLLIGVLICSMDCEEFTAFVASPDFKEQVQKWAQRIGFFPPKYLSWPIIGKWLSRFAGEAVAEADKAYLLQQMAVFQNYIREGLRKPAYWDKTPGDQLPGLHWPKSIEALRREFQHQKQIWLKAAAEALAKEKNQSTTTS